MLLRRLENTGLFFPKFFWGGGRRNCQYALDVLVRVFMLMIPVGGLHKYGVAGPHCHKIILGGN